MKRLRALLAVTVTLTASVVPPNATAGRSALQRDADAVLAVGITGVLARETSPRGSRTVVSGVGEVGGPAPRADGHFRIGSTNKALVATVVLQLVAERRMSLEDSVEKWLPGFVQGNGYDGRRITIRQLLQHTAGIYDGNFPIIENAQQYYERAISPTPRKRSSKPD
jgi:D-alanyl-D-alanine carboxypeptidase